MGAKSIDEGQYPQGVCGLWRTRCRHPGGAESQEKSPGKRIALARARLGDPGEDQLKRYSAVTEKRRPSCACRPLSQKVKAEGTWMDRS